MYLIKLQIKERGLTIFQAALNYESCRLSKVFKRQISRELFQGKQKNRPFGAVYYSLASREVTSHTTGDNTIIAFLK
jgi:hypothetical protein